MRLKASVHKRKGLKGSHNTSRQRGFRLSKGIKSKSPSRQQVEIGATVSDFAIPFKNSTTNIRISNIKQGQPKIEIKNADSNKETAVAGGGAEG